VKKSVFYVDAGITGWWDVQDMWQAGVLAILAASPAFQALT